MIQSYDLVQQTFWEVFITYIVFLAACILTYPFSSMIYNAVAKGLTRWR